MNARVDFTPMVDMIMLLVTFFMLCTTLIKPQTMELTMPSDKEDLNEENQSQIAASKAITILIDDENTLYFYTGKPDEDGIRAELLKRNVVARQKVEALKREYNLKRTSNAVQEAKMQEEYKQKLKEIKNSDDTPNVIIKASDKSSYKNLMDILDEMLICNIGKYVIDNFADGDRAKIDAFKANPAQ